MSKAKLWPQYFAGISAATGSWALGTVIGWSAPVEVPIKAGELGFGVSEFHWSWIGSLLPLGAAIICIPIGFVMDGIGRKWTMFMLMPPFIIAWAVLAWSKHVAMLYISRFVLGMCGGAFSVIAPVYTTEIAQTKVRGILGCFFQMLITIGILYAFVFGAICNYVVFTILCGIVPLVSAILIIFIPESPVFFMMKNKPEKAEKSLQWLRGKEYDIAPDVKEIQENVRKIKEKPESLGEAFKRPATLKALLYSMLMMFFQQLSGINAVLFYSTELFSRTQANIKAMHSTIIIGAVQVGATFIALFLIDRLGRRVLLMISSLSMCIATTGLGVYFIILSRDSGTALKISWLPLLCLILYIIMFSFGMGAIPWLINAELFAEDVKGAASAIAATFNWSMGFLVTNVYVHLKNALGVGQTFFIFAGVLLICFVFVLFVLPETKNKTFAEIQILLEGKGGKEGKENTQ